MKKKKQQKNKNFVFEITAMQKFSILWDIEADTEETARDLIDRKFRNFVIDGHAGECQDNKGLSEYWTSCSLATISEIKLEDEYKI